MKRVTSKDCKCECGEAFVFYEACVECEAPCTDPEYGRMFVCSNLCYKAVGNMEEICGECYHERCECRKYCGYCGDMMELCTCTEGRVKAIKAEYY